MVILGIVCTVYVLVTLLSFAFLITPIALSRKRKITADEIAITALFAGFWFIGIPYVVIENLKKWKRKNDK